MNKQCTSSSIIFQLPVLRSARPPMPAVASSSTAAPLIPANTPPALKALGGTVRSGGLEYWVPVRVGGGG